MQRYTPNRVSPRNSSSRSLKNPKYFSSLTQTEKKLTKPSVKPESEPHSYYSPTPSNSSLSFKKGQKTPRTPGTTLNRTNQTPRSSMRHSEGSPRTVFTFNSSLKSSKVGLSSKNPLLSSSGSSSPKVFARSTKQNSLTSSRSSAALFDKTRSNNYSRMSADKKNDSKRKLERSRSEKSSLGNLITQVKKNESNGTNQDQAKAKGEVIYREHLFQTFQALKFVRNLPQVDPLQLRSKRVNLPKRPGYEKKKTMVFDLDETLVHCCEDIESSKPDVVLPIVFPTGEVINAGVNIRPYVYEVLKEANKDFEVIVFTASHQCYADVVLNYLDPTGELIHHRLYRDNCVVTAGVYIKDLRIFNNRRIQDIVIVDNAAYSFGYQIDNGIPIISWHDDRYDKELYNLIDYIKVLARAADIREINRQTFRLRSFYEDYIKQFMGSPNSPQAPNSPKPKIT